MHRLEKSHDEVTNDDRERTKRVVYAVIYGVGKIGKGCYARLLDDYSYAVYIT